MTTELLEQITKLINDFNTTTQFTYITECMELLNIHISEQDLEKQKCSLPNYKLYENKDIYTQIIIKHIETLLTKEQLETFHKSLLTYYAAFISNDEIKKQKIIDIINNNGITDWQNTIDYTINHIINYINDDDFILTLLNKYIDKLDIYNQITLVTALKNNDDIKISYIDKITHHPYKLYELISSIQNDETKIKFFNKYEELLEEEDIKFENILPTLKDDNIKLEYLIKNASLSNKRFYKNILYTLQKEESYLLLWDYVNNECKEIIIHSIKDINKQYEYIKLLNQEAKKQNKKIKSKNLSEIISKFPLDIIKKLIDECDMIGIDIIPTIKNSNDQEFNIKLLKKYGNNHKSKIIRKQQLIHSDYIIQNIDLFLELEKVPNKEKIKEIILELYVTNNDIVHTVIWEFLQEKYIKTLGLEKINILSSYPQIIEKLVKFTDHQYTVFYKCLNHYVNKYNSFDWNNAAYQMLAEIYFNIVDYNDITQYVTNINTVNLDNLVYILLNGDIIGIKSQEDINNYQQLLLEKSNKQIKNVNLDEKKDAIFIKGFGLSDYSNLLRSLREQKKHGIRQIYDLYKSDIDLIENDEIKLLFNFIQSIVECNSDTKLIEIYNNLTQNHLDTYKIEALLKNEYLKLYNRLLLDPKKLQKNKEGLYDAGVDFNIITTSVGAYCTTNPENYKNDWNRPSLASPHFCASFIRNDMLGTAPVKNILYGFSNMGANSLVLSGSVDIYSSGANLISKADINEKYYGPDKQINNSSKNTVHKYNEMDFKRIQNGIKKSPDYILVFQKDGIIENIDEAKKASKDWDDLPIVVIDINKVIAHEKEKLTKLITEYYTTPNQSLLEKIIDKIRNNQVIEPSFSNEISLEELKNLISNKPIFKTSTLI